MAKTKTEMILDIIKDVVLNPRKHDWIIGAPTEFEAAEYLYWCFLEKDLPKRLCRKVDDILLRSGKYFHLNNIQIHSKSEWFNFSIPPFVSKMKFIELT